ncbi:MAG: RNA polymerase sigma factor [Nitrospira sp.]|nr:RNA polymerase sigma factor [Nitrospira sp.]
MMGDCFPATTALSWSELRLPMADESLTVSETAPEDRDLLRRIREGDTERFAELISRYQQHVVRIVTRRVPADEVETTVHDVFVRAYFGLAQFSDSVSFDHWLAGIAVRTCYDFWRSRRRGEWPVSALTDAHHRWIEQALAAASDEEFKDHARRGEAAEVLRWALGRLSPEHRAVLTLVHLEGRSVREAAELLGWSTVNVKVRAFRARRAIRDILNKSSRGGI